ncbi:MAG: hypothetical protein R2809_09830 [Flavobacteriales bacterium]
MFAFFWTDQNSIHLNSQIAQKIRSKQNYSHENKEILWSVDWQSNNGNIAVGGNIDSLLIYDSKTFKKIKSFQSSNTITNLAWHPSENKLAVNNQLSEYPSYLFLFEEDKKIYLEGICADGARGLDWNYNGEFLIIGDNDGQILIYNRSGELIRKFTNQSTSSITSIACHPRKNIFLVLSDKIRIFDINGKLLLEIKHRPEKVILLTADWHPSGSMFATGDYGNINDPSLLQFWSESGEQILTVKRSLGEYRCVKWNKKGDQLATASDKLRIWNKNGTLKYEGNSQSYLWGLSWNDKGSRIITTSLLENIELWKSNGKQIKSLNHEALNKND